MDSVKPLILGMMSGTSADGIDAAIVHFGESPELVRFSQHPMPEGMREPILRLAAPGVDEIDALGELDKALGEAYARVALAAIAAAGLRPGDIAAIGNHGQTIRHRPKARHPFSLQIGCPSTVAAITGITTVADFRRRDMASGGEGAPLVPYAHRVLFAAQDATTAILNIGGIANITWMGQDGGVLGFDTGPGNMVMDGLMLALSDGRHGYDADGQLAASGHVCQPLLEQLLAHLYFKRRPPKSTGREEFGQATIDAILAWPRLCDADRLATAAEFTARTIAGAVPMLPQAPQRWFVCGGGACNRHLMRRLGSLLSPATVATTEVAGIPPAAVEAVSFAILAHRTLQGIPNTLARVTGARADSVGGHIVPGDNWLQLLQAIPTWTR